MERDKPGGKNKDFILKIMTLWENCRERVGEMNYDVMCVSVCVRYIYIYIYHFLYIIPYNPHNV